MLLLVPFGGTWYFVPPILIVGRALFLISVAIVWYFVGRLLDQRRAPVGRESTASEQPYCCTFSSWSQEEFCSMRGSMN